MKRLWIGAALLLLLLAAGVFSTVATARFHHSLSQRLEATASAAMAQDWEAAGELLHQCRSRWARWRNFVAAGVSHEPIEQIDMLYAQLEFYFRRRDSLGFALCCTALRHQTQAVGEAQSLNWWNLL